MNARRLIHPWQLAMTWTPAHRHPRVVVLDARAVPAHWWSAHTLPDSRSHYYPRRCVYLESASMSRMMDRL